MGDIIDLYEMIKELEERIEALENQEEQNTTTENTFDNQTEEEINLI